MAYERFGAHVESLIDKASGDWAIGEELYDALLTEAEGLAYGTRALRDKGQAAYDDLAADMVLSVLVRWPLVGLMLASVTGDITAWRQDPAIVRLCTKLTLILALPCVVRVAVQYPLYVADRVGWLGVTKIALGWPLQVAALAAMAWLLARGRTPLVVPPEVSEPDPA